MLSIRKIRVSVFSVQLYNHRTGVIQSEADPSKIIKGGCYMKKTWLAVLLACIMAFSLISVVAVAEKTEEAPGLDKLLSDLQAVFSCEGEKDMEKDLADLGKEFEAFFRALDEQMSSESAKLDKSIEEFADSFKNEQGEFNPDAIFEFLGLDKEQIMSEGAKVSEAAMEWFSSFQDEKGEFNPDALFELLGLDKKQIMSEGEKNCDAVKEWFGSFQNEKGEFNPDALFELFGLDKEQVMSEGEKISEAVTEWFGSFQDEKGEFNPDALFELFGLDKEQVMSEGEKISEAVTEWFSSFQDEKGEFNPDALFELFGLDKEQIMNESTRVEKAVEEWFGSFLNEQGEFDIDAIGESISRMLGAELKTEENEFSLDDILSSPYFQDLTKWNAAVDAHVIDEYKEVLEPGDAQIVVKVTVPGEEDDFLKTLGYFELINFKADDNALKVLNSAAQVEYLRFEKDENGDFVLVEDIHSEDGDGFEESVKAMCEMFGCSEDQYYTVMEDRGYSEVSALQILLDTYPEYEKVEYMGELKTREELEQIMDALIGEIFAEAFSD